MSASNGRKISLNPLSALNRFHNSEAKVGKKNYVRHAVKLSTGKVAYFEIWNDCRNSSAAKIVARDCELFDKAIVVIVSAKPPLIDMLKVPIFGAADDEMWLSIGLLPLVLTPFVPICLLGLQNVDLKIMHFFNKKI